MSDGQLRVLLVLATSEGGIGMHVRSLAAGLAGQGCAVTVAGPETTNERFGFADAGVSFQPTEISTTLHPVADLHAIVRLRAVITDAGSQIMHAHGLRAGALAGLARGPRRRPPLVVTWHNAVLGSGPKRSLLRGLERLVANIADVTLGASYDLVVRARQVGAADARLGPVAAPALPPPVRTRDEVRAALGARERPIVLAAGRLAPQKSYDLLLEAARRWKGRSPPPLTLIAGEGPERPDLEARIAAADLPVRLLGYRSDLSELLIAADVVVVTSEWEARAMVAQEALRAGRPLVATAVGGIPDLVGDAGVLIPYGDAHALAEAVDTVLQDPGLAARLAADGLEQANTWPTESDTVNSLLALYTSVATAAVPR